MFQQGKKLSHLFHITGTLLRTNRRSPRSPFVRPCSTRHTLHIQSLSQLFQQSLAEFSNTPRDATNTVVVLLKGTYKRVFWTTVEKSWQRERKGRKEGDRTKASGKQDKESGSGNHGLSSTFRARLRTNKSDRGVILT